MAEGRTLDNSSNINYLLQDYSTSIEYFDKRLTIAKECNDQIGQRRAHINLGNAYLYLEDFDKALNHYREAMVIAEKMNDGLIIAQINFIFGRVYNIKQEYETSIYFHEKHLNLAQQFQDSQGQCRAYFILSQLYEKINQHDKGKKYFSLYKALLKEIDKSQEGKNHFLKNFRAESVCVDSSEPPVAHSVRSNSIVTSPTEEKGKKLKLSFMQHLTKKSPLIIRKQTSTSEHDDLADLVHRMQKSRFDDQRCDVKMTNQNDKHRPSSQLEDILNTVDRLQQFRLDDQRTTFPKPSRLAPLNEQFFDQLAKCQDSRMNDQRAVLLPLSISASSSASNLRPMSSTPVITTPTASQTKTLLDESTSKTLPDEDFFSLLNRLQSRQSSLSSTINTRIK